MLFNALFLATYAYPRNVISPNIFFDIGIVACIVEVMLSEQKCLFWNTSSPPDPETKYLEVKL